MRKVRSFLKKFDKNANFLQRFFEKICKFFKRKIKKFSKERIFTKIDKFSLFERIRLRVMVRKTNLLYGKHLENLRKAVKCRRLKVVFVVKDPAKWHCGALYNLLLESENFEPLLLLTNFTPMEDNGTSYEERFLFFKNLGLRIEKIYDTSSGEYLKLETFRPDILFQEQPWEIEFGQGVIHGRNFALTCYVPYCFHLLVSSYDYLESFHRFLWKYFVESPLHLKSYEKRFNATNCVAVGSLHLDGYLSEKEPDISFWKDKSPEKKRIIYAPHFSIEYPHKMATFPKNGRFILDLAGMYPQTTWVFKPHPSFFANILDLKIMTRSDLDSYCDEWKNYGTIHNCGNFCDLFRSSDCLITDSISFLADYFPTGNPVLHLRSDKQTNEFNEFGQCIVETYYQIHENSELDALFSRVVINGDDFMKDKRKAHLEKLKLLDQKSAGARVFEYLRSELKIQ